MSLLDRVVRALFESSPRETNDGDQSLVDDLTESVVDIVEPRVRLRTGYRDKLADGMRVTIAHLRKVGQVMPAPIELSRGGWSNDPHVRAFFVSAADVTTFIGHGSEPRGFFDQHAGCPQAFALLGMQREERRVLAPRLEGGILRQDVAQTTVSFAAHRLLAPAEDEAQTRLEIGRRIVQRLAQLVLARIVAVDALARDLHQLEPHLRTKLRMLQQGRDGMLAVVGDPSAIDRQMADVRRALEEAIASGRQAQDGPLTMDSYIEHINAVLVAPDRHVRLTRFPMRLNLLGTKVDQATSEETVNDLELTDLFIGEGLSATIALVRIPRDELPPREDLLAHAERFM